MNSALVASALAVSVGGAISQHEVVVENQFHDGFRRVEFSEMHTGLLKLRFLPCHTTMAARTPVVSGCYSHHTTPLSVLLRRPRK